MGLSREPSLVGVPGQRDTVSQETRRKDFFPRVISKHLPSLYKAQPTNQPKSNVGADAFGRLVYGAFSGAYLRDLDDPKAAAPL